MRLIDATALIDEYSFREKRGDNVDFVELVERQPTIDCKPVQEAQGEMISNIMLENENLKGQVRALVFAMRCYINKGEGVVYEVD